MASDHKLFERLIFLFATMIVITILLVVLSGFLSAFDKDVDLAMQQRVQKWIAPIGEAYTKDRPPPRREEQSPEYTTAASTESADNSLVAGSAADDDAGGSKAKQTYDSVCAVCHATGLMNAPKFGDAAVWKKRLSEQGLDALYRVALRGRKGMPAKGGNPALSDALVKSTVDYMLKHSEGTP